MWTADAAARSADTSEATTDGGVARDAGNAIAGNAEPSKAFA